MRIFNVRTLHMHSLVNSWAKNTLFEEERKVYREAATRLLVCTTGEGDEDIFEFVSLHIDLLEPWEELHVNDCVGIVNLLLHQGRLDRCIPLCEWVFNQVSDRNREHSTTYIASLVVAKAYWRSQDRDLHELAAEKEKYAQQCLRSYFDARSSPLVKARIQFAQGLRRKGKNREARSVLSDTYSQLGEEDDQALILEVMHELAITCSQNGIREYEEAEELFTLALTGRISLLGEGHWKTIQTKRELAQLHLRKVQAGEDKDGTSLEAAVNNWTQLKTVAEKKRGLTHHYTRGGTLMELFTLFLQRNPLLPFLIEPFLEKAKGWVLPKPDGGNGAEWGFNLRANILNDELVKRRLINKFNHYLDPPDAATATQQAINTLHCFILNHAETCSNLDPGTVLEAFIERLEPGEVGPSELLDFKWFLALCWLAQGNYERGFEAWVAMVEERADRDRQLGTTHEDTTEAEQLLARSIT
ncbi:hypothetical protein CPB86DRAFT_501656 [Serendipita vermifera]|nr:hypothetical protein CPB86DRAFT_501656 [Serendipita vermifera]